MYLIPDVLDLIAIHLPMSSIHSCLHVSRLWNTVFTPYIWRNVNDGIPPWTALLQPNPETSIDTITEFEKGLQYRLRKHAPSIRELTICEGWILNAAVDAGLSNLRYLEIQGPFFLDRFYQNRDSHSLVFIHDDLDVREEYFTDKESHFTENWDGETEMGDIMDGAWYHASYHKALMHSVLVWQLIASNRYLESIVFVAPLERELLPLSMNRSATSFLAETLTRMPQLRHIEIGANAAAFILKNLTTVAPHITSFVFTPGFENEPGDIHDSFLASLMTTTPCPTLLSLTIAWTITDTAHLRSILRTFPSLQELALPGLGRFGDSERYLPIVEYEELVHDCLIVISGNIITDILHLNIHLPNLKQFGPIDRIKSDEELVAVLAAFPKLEHLEIEALEGIEKPHFFEPERSTFIDPFEKLTNDLPLKTLIVKSGPYRSDTWTKLVAFMPHLVTVYLQDIPNETLVELSQTCHDLEHAHFDSQDPSRQKTQHPCHLEMAQLLVGCPKLKTCTGAYHAMWTSALEMCSPWTCTNIERLSCEIQGVPRLDFKQERLLEKRQRQGQNISYIPSKEEQIAVQIQHKSNIVQKQILRRFACLTELRELNLNTKMPPSISRLHDRLEKYSLQIHGNNYSNSGSPWPNDLELAMYQSGQLQFWTRRFPTQPVFNICTLEMTLSSGLTELATLTKLTRLSVKGINHFIRKPEIDWMIENWPQLREIDGLNTTMRQYFNAHRRQF
ncbi:hypothetical protein FBU30_009116 [Linnemannia zychae]|nr:hypothetical protein FBU30_009116 [Linnemannia zychae]